MSSHRNFMLLAALCAMLAALVLLPGLGGAFLLDDEPTITDNPAVQITDLSTASLMQAAYGFKVGGGSRALPMLTFGLDYWRAGLDPAAFKATNILIHALTAIALACFFRLVLAMSGWPRKRAELMGAALALTWAIHPLQVSSVLYIVQRMQTMGTLFLILALWAYLKMRQAQIAGERSRQYGVITGLAWVLALASKEDSILLPAYALALELTVLRFRAAQPGLAKGLRRAYMLATLVGGAIFLAIVVPRYWHWDAYPTRDYSSWERLLTQTRVLAMYLSQILFPLPSHLPFHYDWLQPSRGLLQPWSTLPSVLLVLGMLGAAWLVRVRRPMFALGVFLFFAGHFITSNVVGLELAFEHRNHFPLIGAVLAIGDLLVGAIARMRLQRRAAIAAFVLLLAALGGATLMRATTWGSPLGFAQAGTRIAPQSERAWIDLCRIHFDLSAGDPENPHFEEALHACSKGSTMAYGASNLASLAVMKSIKGIATPDDWNLLQERMRTTTMTASNAGVAWYLVRYSNGDARVDARNVIPVIDIVGARAGFRPEEYAGFGYYAAKKGLDAEAYRYFAKAIENSPPRSTLPAALVADLHAEGHVEWARRLEAFARSQGKWPVVAKVRSR
jgi:protein O-mannosyl-transferase